MLIENFIFHTSTGVNRHKIDNRITDISKIWYHMLMFIKLDESLNYDIKRLCILE